MTSEDLVFFPFFQKARISQLPVYLESGGFDGWKKAIAENRPAAVLKALKESGLRERDSTGFPTGMKWEFLSSPSSQRKYLVVKIEDGEPGNAKDVWLMEKCPWLVLEGILIAVWALRITGLIFVVPQKRPVMAVQISEQWNQMLKAGFLKTSGEGKALNLPIPEFRRGMGVFTGNEETALVEFLEGRKICGRARSHFPVLEGYKSAPTLITNPETLANVPLIVANGGEWFAEKGCPSQPGSRLFCITGAVRKPGVYELSSRATIEDALTLANQGKGIAGIRAVAPGGMGSGFLPAEFFQTHLDHLSLALANSSSGNGAFIAYSHELCPVELVRKHLQFFQEVSCGECVPCREGSIQLHAMFRAFTDGKSRLQYERSSVRVAGPVPPMMPLLRDLVETIRLSARCGVGRQVVAGVSSLLEHFPQELDSHWVRRECPAQTCRM